jgi:hypothetical protein
LVAQISRCGQNPAGRTFLSDDMRGVMNLKPSRRSTWPRQGSFVIRIRQQAPEEWTGRIEHVQSGGRGRFQNLMELMQFVESHLDQPDEDRSP